MELEELQNTNPRSMPVALKVTGAELLDTASVEKEIPPTLALAGMDSNTADGTVNVWAEAGAWHVKVVATKSVVLFARTPNEVPVMPT